MENKKELSSRILEMNFMKKKNINDDNKKNYLFNDDNWVLNIDNINNNNIDDVIDDVFLNNRPKKITNIIFKNSRIKSNIKKKHKNNLNNNSHNKNKINKNN